MPSPPLLTITITVIACAVVMLVEGEVTITGGVVVIVDVALFTVWLNSVALLVENALPVPGEYTAVMLWVPVANVLVV